MCIEHSRTRRVLQVLLCAVIVLFMMPAQSAHAAAMPADRITLDIRDIPDNAVYIDLLADIRNIDNYIEFDKDFMDKYDFDPTELAQFSEGGFVSFSCHYKGEKADMRIKEGKTVFAEKNTVRQLSFYETSVRIAVLDKDGHIIQISDSVKINDTKDDRYLCNHGEIEYSIESNEIQADIFDNKWGGRIVNYPLFYGLIIVIGGLVAALIVLRIKNSRKRAVQAAGGTVRNGPTVFGVLSVITIIAGIGLLLFLIFPAEFVILLGIFF